MSIEPIKNQIIKKNSILKILIFYLSDIWIIVGTLKCQCVLNHIIIFNSLHIK